MEISPVWRLSRVSVANFMPRDRVMTSRTGSTTVRRSRLESRIWVISKRIESSSGLSVPPLSLDGHASLPETTKMYFAFKKRYKNVARFAGRDVKQSSARRAATAPRHPRGTPVVDSLAPRSRIKPVMNPLAAELNAVLAGTVADALLSDLGRRMFFPKGIVAQSAEAKKHATRANATIGIATRGGKPVFLQAIRSLVPGLDPDEIFPYAPTQGVEKLRELWKKEIVRKNPDIGTAAFSLPLVVPGLTCGISTLADLFVDKGDTLVLPDLHWDNYPLIFETRREARSRRFPFYGATGGFNVDGPGCCRAQGRREGQGRSCC